MYMKSGQSKVETNGPLASGITKKDCEEKQFLFSQKRGRWLTFPLQFGTEKSSFGLWLQLLFNVAFPLFSGEGHDR